MTEKERTLFFSIFSQPFFGFGLRPQIELMESCISAKTVVAANSKVAKPMMAAIVPLPLTVAFLIISCICAALSAPKKSSSCRYIWPSTACCPKKILERNIITISRGPNEKNSTVSKGTAQLGELILAKSFKGLFKYFEDSFYRYSFFHKSFQYDF